MTSAGVEQKCAALPPASLGAIPFRPRVFAAHRRREAEDELTWSLVSNVEGGLHRIKAFALVAHRIVWAKDYYSICPGTKRAAARAFINNGGLFVCVEVILDAQNAHNHRGRSTFAGVSRGWVGDVCSANRISRIRRSATVSGTGCVIFDILADAIAARILNRQLGRRSGGFGAVAGAVAAGGGWR